jgi:hypothetical protein
MLYANTGDNTMCMKPRHLITILITVGVIIFLMAPIKNVFAHCDTLDGPVIEAARVALEKGEVTPVLKWIPKEHEQEIRDVFSETLVVRVKGKEARELADRYFFETLVRVHRAGEGEPYTGLKSASTIEPAITAADKALQNASVDTLADKISNAVREAIKKRFDTALEKKKHADDSVEGGRDFVEAYVQYVHFVEGIHDLVVKGAEHHHSEKHGRQ